MVALASSACDPRDRQYFRDGVGTDLYWSGLAEATQLQNAYVGNICQQAGLPVFPGVESPVCSDTGFGPVEWTLFVQAGMNDIDQRCDNYLSWLDSKRRAAAPIHQQILDTQTAAASILIATHAGAQAISLVGAAFGFAAHTFTNINSRLLFEIDQSTVQAVVLNRQNLYRLNLTPRIDNRAAAVYALRSYLRLCMPMTIETEINTTVKLFERGGAAALAAVQQRPLITTATVRSALIRDVAVPIVRPPVAPRVIVSPGESAAVPTRLSDFERSLTVNKIKEFQRAACVDRVDGSLGPRGSATRQAIKAAINASSDILTDRSGALLEEITDAKTPCPRG